jgi:hypothetical protein
VSGYSGFSGYSGVAPSAVANLSGGTTGSLPYQSSANTTTFLNISGQTGNLLVAGASTPTYTAPSGISGIGSANNLVGGAALQIPYQSAANTTSFSPTATVGSSANPGFLAYNGTGFVWSQWKTYLTNTNINAALGYTAADAAGSNASGTWGINITGNAATASGAGGSFFTNGAGTENDIGAALSGYNAVYLFNNTSAWGLYSATGGVAVQYTRSTGRITLNGTAGTLGSGGNGGGAMTFTYSGNNTNPTYVWGTAGLDLNQNVLYSTGALSVSYANSAGSAAAINSDGGLQNMTSQTVGSLIVGYYYGTPSHINDVISGAYIYTDDSYGSYNLPGAWRLLGSVISASVQLYVRVY